MPCTMTYLNDERGVFFHSVPSLDPSKLGADRFILSLWIAQPEKKKEKRKMYTCR